MSAKVTEEVMRWGLRFCSRRSPWQQCSFQMAASVKYTSFPSRHLAHIWRQSQTRVDRSPVSSVRFYSQDRTPPEESSLPTEIQTDETASRQIQRRSPFLVHLQRCVSPTDVLDLTDKYAPTFREASHCLSHMWFIMKKMTDEQLRYEMQLMFEHPAFDRLLQSAMKGVGVMNSHNLVYSLLAMVKLGVPQQSRAVQTFLRACQEDLNNFDEKSLSILASCLEQMKDDTNTVALKQGMRFVVEARLPGIKNVMALQIMMRLLGKDAPLDLKRKLEKKALSMSSQFSPPNTQYMISTMATMGFHSRPLLDVCSKKLTENIHGAPLNKLLMVLWSCRKLCYRDVDLFTSISVHIASTFDVWSRKQVVLVLHMFESLSFCPAALMEVFAEKVVADPDSLTLKDLLCVLKVYSVLNYDLQHQRQQFLDSLSRVLESYLPKMSAFQLLKSVYCLCLLGHFPSAPLELLMQSTTLDKFYDAPPQFCPNQERKFQTVNSCLRLDRPPVPQPLTVPSSLLGDSAPSSQSANPLLSQCLHRVLEEQTDTQLQEMVLLENIYLIDGLISRRLPTEASSCAGEARPPAESSQRIAVICTSRSDFCCGTSDPRGPLAVKIRHLKILGYEPVWVTEQELQEKSEEKRLDFLRERLFPDTQPEVEQPDVVLLKAL